MSKRGFFGLAMYHPKTPENWGSMLRTANLMGCSFIATIGQRFKRESSDTLKTWRHVPVFRFVNFEDFKTHLPFECRLVGIEMDDNAYDLKNYCHPERACYLLGAEDYGLPSSIKNQCHDIVKLKGERSMNVSCAGSIVLYHRNHL